MSVILHIPTGARVGTLCSYSQRPRYSTLVGVIYGMREDWHDARLCKRCLKSVQTTHTEMIDKAAEYLKDDVIGIFLLQTMQQV